MNEATQYRPIKFNKLIQRAARQANDTSTACCQYTCINMSAARYKIRLWPRLTSSCLRVTLRDVDTHQSRNSNYFTLNPNMDDR